MYEEVRLEIKARHVPQFELGVYDSKGEAVGAFVNWVLSKATIRAGQFIQFEYSTDSPFEARAYKISQFGASQYAMGMLSFRTRRKDAEDGVLPSHRGSQIEID